jgi:uncharacterized Ntn-hydrolase superfamily protein
MTYSIVARDPDTGRFGVAVQTCWPFVGASVPWVESGVGAVATQAYTEIAHGPNGLAGMRPGGAAPDVLARILAADAGREIRQVGIVDAAGRAAAHTGASCVPAAGHLVADGVAVQANMMERAAVWPAMLAAWRAASGPFEERLLVVLRAAEGEGGDIRGRQSAAIVVSGTPDEPPWKRATDLRVDDHPAPLDELERLLRLQRAFEALDRAEELAAAGNDEAGRAAGEEAIRLSGGDAQIVVWTAIGMAGAGPIEPARAMLAEASARNPRWPEFVRRVVAAGVQPELAGAARALLGD